MLTLVFLGWSQCLRRVGSFSKLSGQNVFPSLSIQWLPTCSLTYGPYSIFDRYHFSCCCYDHIISYAAFFIRSFSCFLLIENIMQYILIILTPSLPPSSQIHPHPYPLNSESPWCVAFHWSPSVNWSSSPSNYQLPILSQLGAGLQTSSLLRVGVLSGLSLSTRTTSLLFPVVTLCLGLLQSPHIHTFHSNPSDLGGGACRDVQLRAEWFTVLCSASWPVVSLCIHHHLLQKEISWMTIERGTMGTSISLLYHYYTYG